MGENARRYIETQLWPCQMLNAKRQTLIYFLSRKYDSLYPK